MKQFILFSGIIIILTFSSMCIFDNEKWEPGEVVIQFKEGVNQTQAKGIISSYNLTIVWISEDDVFDNIEAHVDVPKGEEKQYANMLKEDPNIDDAYQMPPEPGE